MSVLSSHWNRSAGWCRFIRSLAISRNCPRVTGSEEGGSWFGSRSEIHVITCATTLTMDVALLIGSVFRWFQCKLRTCLILLSLQWAQTEHNCSLKFYEWVKLAFLFSAKAAIPSSLWFSKLCTKKSTISTHPLFDHWLRRDHGRSCARNANPQ